MKIGFINIFKKSVRKIRVEKPIGKKGFVIFQIDGLSYDALMKALKMNMMPHLKRMIKSGNHKISKYFTGVPSDTPYFQAGLLYGNNDDIPGFRWIERGDGEEIIFKKPESAGRIEELLASKKPGLLDGGSSYVNLFSGGASRSTFTLSTFSIRYLFKKKIRNFDIFIIFVFHIFTLIKTFIYVFLEVLLELWERAVDSVKKRQVRPEGFFPFARAVSNVLFKEIETFGAIMDISRGVPSIYLDYIGYDELSHHRGPYSISALGTLKAIDSKIRHIHRAIAAADRHYDFFVISDHGHTPSVPFSMMHDGSELSGIILGCLKINGFEVFEFDTGYDAAFKRFLVYIRDFFKKGKCAELLDAVLGRMDSKKNNESKPLAWGGKNTAYIMDSGPMANIYFSGNTSRMTVEKIEREFPGLAAMIAATRGIGFVAGINENGEVCVFDIKSDIFINMDDYVSKSERAGNTMACILSCHDGQSLKDSAVSSVKNFCGFKNSGDLVVFGEYDGKRIVNFENQMGAHGGIGGEQNVPFAVWGKDVPFDFAGVDNSCKIYEFLYNKYVRD